MKLDPFDIAIALCIVFLGFMSCVGPTLVEMSRAPCVAIEAPSTDTDQLGPPR